MAVKQIYKRIKRVNLPQRVKVVVDSVVEEPKEVEQPLKKNKVNKKKDIMKLEEIAKAEELVDSINKPEKVKVIKKERGLIERTESEKIILAEDNRQILTD